jgi:hypothetical protein
VRLRVVATIISTLLAPGARASTGASKPLGAAQPAMADAAMKIAGAKSGKKLLRAKICVGLRICLSVQFSLPRSVKIALYQIRPVLRAAPLLENYDLSNLSMKRKFRRLV